MYKWDIKKFGTKNKLCRFSSTNYFGISKTLYSKIWQNRRRVAKILSETLEILMNFIVVTDNNNNPSLQSYYPPSDPLLLHYSFQVLKNYQAIHLLDVQSKFMFWRIRHLWQNKMILLGIERTSQTILIEMLTKGVHKMS